MKPTNILAGVTVWDIVICIVLAFVVGIVCAWAAEGDNS